MKLKRLASTLAAVAIAGGGAITMSAVTTAPAHADGGFDHDGWGHHGWGHHRAFAGGANVCTAAAVKKVVKKRGGGQFARYFGGHRKVVVKKLAKKYVRCASWHRRAAVGAHKRFGHHGKFDHGKFGGHERFGHKGFGHKGFGGGW